MDDDVNDDISMQFAFVAKFCSSSSLKCTLITPTLPPNQLCHFRSRRMRMNLLNVGPDLHISGWSLLLDNIEFVLHCNI